MYFQIIQIGAVLQPFQGAFSSFLDFA
jgi:hypothetical protein